MKNLVIILFISTLLFSCGTTNVVKYLYKFENINKTQADVIHKERIFGRYNHYYADNNIEMHFDLNPYEIGVQVKNLSDEALRLIWDDIHLVTGIDETKKFNILHTNLTQEKIDLGDTTIENYDQLILIKELQKEDTAYSVRPTIILPGMTIVDVLKNKDKGYFLPYEQRDREKLKREAEKMIDVLIKLNFIYIKNDEKEVLPIQLKIKDYYIINKG